jgi:serine-type D-Ala-D-Ala carboxypeptidase/endopeptidase (penicillin-binding protein 4)
MAPRPLNELLRRAPAAPEVTPSLVRRLASTVVVVTAVAAVVAGTPLVRAGGATPASLRQATVVVPTTSSSTSTTTTTTAAPEPVASTAPAPTTTAPPPPPPPGSLPARLADLTADPSVAGRDITVRVAGPAGEEVFDHRGDDPLLPASTQKLLTAAAALLSLGPDHRFVTRVQAAAPVASDGVVHGPLVLVGDGDPSLGSPAYGTIRSGRPRTPLELLADQVVAAGVRRVTGGVLGDPTVFADEPMAPGWLPGYIARGDSSLSSGLTVDGGRRVFRTGRGWQSAPARDPAAQSAFVLAGLLAERGVQVEGPIGSNLSPPPGVALLGAVPSVPLVELLRVVVQDSDNHLADGIFRSVGAAAGDSSWVGAGRAVATLLQGLGLDTEGLVLADGSGLSRDDRVAARILTDLDLVMSGSPLAAAWDSLLAASGESGTLRGRLVGSIAQHRLRGKTGTLNDVRALAGIVVGDGGTRYRFVVTGNELDTSGVHAVRALQDRVVLTLSAEARGCTWVVVPGEPGPGHERCG